MKKVVLTILCLCFVLVPNYIKAEDVTFTGEVDVIRNEEEIIVITPIEDDAFYVLEKPLFQIECDYNNPVVTYYDKTNKQELECIYYVGENTVDIEISKSGKYIVRQGINPIETHKASTKYIAPKTGIN